MTDDLKAEIREILDGRDRITIRNDPGSTTIDVSIQDGDGVDITFSELKALSTLLGTDLIDLGHETPSGGCETCDYGKVYDCDITCRGVTHEGIR